jgi:phosphoserine phosphatase RsbU/P
MATQLQRLLTVEAARQDKELKTAQMVQGTLFPKNNSRGNSKLGIEGHYQPASECAGDWWGHFPVNGGNGHVFAIADATGHGASAALLVAVAYSFFNTIEQFYKNEHFSGETLLKILKDLNEILVRSGDGTSTMTMFVGYADIENSILHYVNAGHAHPYFIPRNGYDLRLPKSARRASKLDSEDSQVSIPPPPSSNVSRKKGYSPLLGGGSLLGLNLEPDFALKEMELSQGDKYLFFTDGLTENVNVSGEMLGNGLKEFLSQSNEMDYKLFLSKLYSYAFDHFAGEPMKDDVTLVVFEFLPKPIRTETFIDSAAIYQGGSEFSETAPESSSDIEKLFPEHGAFEVQKG